MNKKLITALLAITLTIPTVVAKAEPTKPATVAVLDTALDTSIPLFQGRIVHEVCVLDWASCANKQKFMEGPGAASMPLDQMRRNGFDHGTQMVYSLIATNPNVNVVFVRIVGATSTGVRQITNETTFVNALDWVLKNKDRFNIQAVSMSQGHNNFPRVKNYCPNTPSTQSRIRSLVSAGIPLFLPAGNARDYSRINWPACIDESISVGATTDYEEIPLWSNVDVNKTDFYALGILDVMGPGSITKRALGTSVSVQVAAANWMQLKTAKPGYTYQQLYDTFKKTSVKVLNPVGLAGDMMTISGALNG
jgi:hypothetical protein